MNTLEEVTTETEDFVASLRKALAIEANMSVARLIQHNTLKGPKKLNNLTSKVLIHTERRDNRLKNYFQSFL